LARSWLALKPFVEFHSQLLLFFIQIKGPDPASKAVDPMLFPQIDAVDLGSYVRKHVTNIEEEKGRRYFDMGLRLMLSYQHEMAARCFLACLQVSNHCALAHGFVALCHSPNYNFKGEAYYESAHHPEEADMHDLLCVFPSQQVADRHSKMAVEKIEELRKLRKKTVGKKGKGSKGKGKLKKSESTEIGNGDSNLPNLISDVESQLVLAIRKLTCHPGLDYSLSDDIVGRPYADAMRGVYEKYPDDPEVAYCFGESLMVLNAWQLYEFPTGKEVSPDVVETRGVLEKALLVHTDHAGLCHMYVHLSEMSGIPEKALTACIPLRNNFPHAGHLIHMPTHIDVLVGDYESCVRYNRKAIAADERSMQNSPGTAGRESFYFGYIVHNYHMAVYGAILGGFEGKAMELAGQLNEFVCESMFEEYPDLTAYLESYSALDIHVLVRFGRWKEILELVRPKDKRLMLFRAASITFARALAHASLGNLEDAKKEANKFDSLREDPDAEHRILHNNSVENLLAVDGVMMHGEIAYREGKCDKAFELLRRAVKMQDNLNYDEPWGKMQPIRHALGGLLLEQGHLEESEKVFRKDLTYHPNNPWALVGLINSLKKQLGSCCVGSDELAQLEGQLQKQRQTEYADYNIKVACACCQANDKYH
jgi:tetratricopeptide (TPR) repeat protein